MALFKDNIDYENYENSVIKDDKQINNDIVIADMNNYNYTFESTTPIESIINKLPGYVAKVTYFNKTPGNQEVYEYPDLSLDDIIVEYSKIENLTIYMENAVDVTDLNNFEGEGYINAGIEPQPGDFILMPLYDKRLGLFVITSTSATTYNFTRIFKINFKFYMFPDAKDIDKINNNTNNELVADNTLNNTGKEILYEKDRYTVIKKVDSLINKYIHIWKNKIITAKNNYTMSYFDKEKNDYIGDTYLENYILNTINITDIPNITLFNKDNDVLTILDIIIDKNNNINDMVYKYKIIPVSDKLNNPVLKSYVYNQISNFTKLDHNEKNYYIFSEEFYNSILNIGDKNIFKTELEKSVYALINDLDIDLKTFNNVLEEIDYYISINDIKNIFYKIPILISIIRYFKFKHNYPNKFLY